MDQEPTLRVVVAVVVFCGLLSVDDVTTLPLQPCESLINHVDSLIAADHPVPADDLSLYLACVGIETQQFDDDDDAVRQLLHLQSGTAAVDDDTPGAARGGWPKSESVSGEVCTTLECLRRLAALTFEPCSRLTKTQCSALVNVLENIVSMKSDVDNDTAAARLLEHFRQLDAHYHNRRQTRVIPDGTRKKRHADTTGQEADKKSVRDTGSVSKSGGSDEVSRRMSLPVTSGAGGARMRRSAVSRGSPFQLSRKLTPESREVVQEYMAWRAQNGYGRISGRWG